MLLNNSLLQDLIIQDSLCKALAKTMFIHCYFVLHLLFPTIPMLPCTLCYLINISLESVELLRYLVLTQDSRRSTFWIHLDHS